MDYGFHEWQSVHGRTLNNIYNEQTFDVIEPFFILKVGLAVVVGFRSDRAAHRMTYKDNRLVWEFGSHVLADNHSFINQNLLTHICLVFTIVSSMPSKIK